MIVFLLRYRNALALGLALSGQLVLLGYQARRNDGAPVIRSWSVTVFAPLAEVLDAFGDGARSGWERYLWLVGARQENEELKAELDRLRLENGELRRAVDRFERRERLSQYDQSLASRVLPAEVIGAGANSRSREILLDRGRQDGVRPGMAVIRPEGVVGKVQAVTERASLAVRIDDASFGFGVILSRSRVHALMKGLDRAEGLVDYVAPEVEVLVGETVYTSGDDRVFPKGLPVGEVTRLEEGRDFRRIYVRPHAKLDRLDGVLIVLEGAHQELPSSPQLGGPPALPPPPVPPAPLPTEGPPADQPVPSALTDADRLVQRYRAMGEAQQHTFGEGLPGSRPPDFNIPLEDEDAVPSVGR